MNEVDKGTAVILGLFFLFLLFLLAIAVVASNGNTQKNASLCQDQGGVYVRLDTGDYDCVGETPSMTRTR